MNTIRLSAETLDKLSRANRLESKAPTRKCTFNTLVLSDSFRDRDDALSFGFRLKSGTVKAFRQDRVSMRWIVSYEAKPTREGWSPIYK